MFHVIGRQEDRHGDSGDNRSIRWEMKVLYANWFADDGYNGPGEQTAPESLVTTRPQPEADHIDRSRMRLKLTIPG
jgi:hypothetical protein